MTTDTPVSRLDESIVNIIRILVLIQGGIAFVSMLEVGFVTATTGGYTILAFVLTLIAAVLTLRMSTGLGRRSRRARRITIRIERAIIVIAFLEVLLTLLLARSLPAPITVITRFVVPFVVIRLLKKPITLQLFDVPAKKKHRRFRRHEPTGATS
jgi:hypothetical protein